MWGSGMWRGVSRRPIRRVVCVWRGGWGVGVMDCWSSDISWSSGSSLRVEWRGDISWSSGSSLRVESCVDFCGEGVREERA